MSFEKHCPYVIPIPILDLEPLMSVEKGLPLNSKATWKAGTLCILLSFNWVAAKDLNKVSRIGV